MKKFMIAAALIVSGLIASAGTDNPACKAEKRNDWSAPVSGMWIKKAAEQKAAEGAIDVLFVGDSITQLWMKDNRWPNGQVVWDKYYKPLKAVNFGIAGDRTENLLWRINEEKMVDGLTPKTIVLLIGVNNLTGWGGRKGGDNPADVAEAVGVIIESLKSKIPGAKILLLGIFPALENADNPIREKIRQVNTLIAKLQDGKTVYFLDFGNKFLSADGSADKAILRDGLHLSEKAYEIWAENMTPYLLDILKNNGNVTMWTSNK